MILPITLTIFSYILGVYTGYQGLRLPVDRPVIYSETFLFILTLVLGWFPALVAIYLAFRISIVFLIILVLARFLVLPTIFNDPITSLIDKYKF